MQAGNLRERVTLQQKTVTRDAYGAEVITWTDIATVWASVEPLRGREFLEQRRDGHEVTTRITVRYRSGLEPIHRAVHRSTVYDIQAVIHQETRFRALELLCLAVG